jgi:hypothetical protein
VKAPDIAAMTATAACESRLPNCLIISLPGQASTYLPPLCMTGKQHTAG